MSFPPKMYVFSPKVVRKLYFDIKALKPKLI